MRVEPSPKWALSRSFISLTLPVESSTCRMLERPFSPRQGQPCDQGHNRDGVLQPLYGISSTNSAPLDLRAALVPPRMLLSSTVAKSLNLHPAYNRMHGVTVARTDRAQHPCSADLFGAFLTGGLPEYIIARFAVIVAYSVEL